MLFLKIILIASLLIMAVILVMFLVMIISVAVSRDIDIDTDDPDILYQSNIIPYEQRIYPDCPDLQ